VFKLRKSGGPRDLEVSMVGLKLGASVLQLGGQDDRLIAELAKVVGISGEAWAVAETDAECDRVRRAAERAGVLVEARTARLGALPCDAESLDVVVAPDLIGSLRMNERVLCLQQVLKVLRPNGRCVVIEAAQRGGIGGLFSQRALDRTYLLNGGAAGALEAEGFRAVRLLAEQEGKSFFEGTK
jgi:ubiquinone/menaquinone biosynthesis C-methylase UbiE